MSTPQDSKRCSKCTLTLPLSEFYRRSRSPDGYDTKCKACDQARKRRYRQANREQKRAETRRWRERNRERERETIRAWRLANGEKSRAHRAVHMACKRGVLVRPDACEGCGNHAHIQAHHDNYSKPLDVRWLCPSCHGLLHAGLSVAA